MCVGYIFWQKKALCVRDAGSSLYIPCVTFEVRKYINHFPGAVSQRAIFLYLSFLPATCCSVETGQDRQKNRCSCGYYLHGIQTNRACCSYKNNLPQSEIAIHSNSVSAAKFPETNTNGKIIGLMFDLRNQFRFVFNYPG